MLRKVGMIGGLKEDEVESACNTIELKSTLRIYNKSK